MTQYSRTLRSGLGELGFVAECDNVGLDDRVYFIV